MRLRPYLIGEPTKRKTSNDFRIASNDFEIVKSKWLKQFIDINNKKIGGSFFDGTSNYHTRRKAANFMGTAA